MGSGFRFSMTCGSGFRRILGLGFRDATLRRSGIAGPQGPKRSR